MARSFGVNSSVYQKAEPEILAWINDTLALDVKVVEEMGTGAIVCSLLDAMFPDSNVPMERVKWGGKTSSSWDVNWNIFNQVKSSLKLGKLDKNLEVDKLEQCKRAETLEIAQWMYGLFEECYPDDSFDYEAYDGPARRALSASGRRGALNEFKVVDMFRHGNLKSQAKKIAPRIAKFRRFEQPAGATALAAAPKRGAAAGPRIGGARRAAPGGAAAAAGRPKPAGRAPARGARAGAAGAAKKRAPARRGPAGRAAGGAAAAAGGGGADAAALVDLQAQVADLESQLAELQAEHEKLQDTSQEIESERDYYFGKVEKVEQVASPPVGEDDDVNEAIDALEEPEEMKEMRRRILEILWEEQGAAEAAGEEMVEEEEEVLDEEVDYGDDDDDLPEDAAF